MRNLLLGATVVVLLMASMAAGCDDIKREGRKAAFSIAGKECEHDCMVIMKEYYTECDRQYRQGTGLHNACYAGVRDGYNECAGKCK